MLDTGLSEVSKMVTITSRNCRQRARGLESTLVPARGQGRHSIASPLFTFSVGGNDGRLRAFQTSQAVTDPCATFAKTA